MNLLQQVYLIRAGTYSDLLFCVLFPAFDLPANYSVPSPPQHLSAGLCLFLYSLLTPNLLLNLHPHPSFPSLPLLLSTAVSLSSCPRRLPFTMSTAQGTTGWMHGGMDGWMDIWLKE